jgi:hypothetical protein
MSDKIVKVPVCGRPGMTVSAKIDVLETGVYTDVGKVVEEELDAINPQQEGYRKDMAKYARQVERSKKK